MKKKLNKLVLTRSIVTSLTPEEGVKIIGGVSDIDNTCHGISCGLGCTYGCMTQIFEGCPPGYSWDDCSEDCTYTCNTGGDFTCFINNCPNYTNYWY